jgi:hypothetical protein
VGRHDQLRHEWQAGVGARHPVPPFQRAPSPTYACLIFVRFSCVRCSVQIEEARGRLGSRGQHSLKTMHSQCTVRLNVMLIDDQVMTVLVCLRRVFIFYSLTSLPFHTHTRTHTHVFLYYISSVAALQSYTHLQEGAVFLWTAQILYWTQPDVCCISILLKSTHIDEKEDAVFHRPGRSYTSLGSAQSIVPLCLLLPALILVCRRTRCSCGRPRSSTGASSGSGWTRRCCWPRGSTSRGEWSQQCAASSARRWRCHSVSALTVGASRAETVAACSCVHLQLLKQESVLGCVAVQNRQQRQRRCGAAAGQGEAHFVASQRACQCQ